MAKKWENRKRKGMPTLEYRNTFGDTSKWFLDEYAKRWRAPCDVAINAWGIGCNNPATELVLMRSPYNGAQYQGFKCEKHAKWHKERNLGLAPPPIQRTPEASLKEGIRIFLDELFHELNEASYCEAICDKHGVVKEKKRRRHLATLVSMTAEFGMDKRTIRKWTKKVNASPQKRRSFFLWKMDHAFVKAYCAVVSACCISLHDAQDLVEQRIGVSNRSKIGRAEYRKRRRKWVLKAKKEAGYDPS